jgi:hypothetical protein
MERSERMDWSNKEAEPLDMAMWRGLMAWLSRLEAQFEKFQLEMHPPTIIPPWLEIKDDEFPKKNDLSPRAGE